MLTITDNSVEVETHRNDLAFLTRCGRCQQKFRPALGLQPFVVGTQRVVCPTCTEQAGLVDVLEQARRAAA